MFFVKFTTQPFLFSDITFIYQNYLEEDNGKCSAKGRRISFLFILHVFMYGVTVALIRLLAWGYIVSSMGNKMKGIFKGFKFIFNNFAVKEMELEIGCPTDVKHVAHIGCDGPSGNAPSWMSQFKKGPDFAVASIGNSGTSLSPWTSQDGDSNGAQSTSEINKDSPTNKESTVKKQRRRKCKATSSPKSSSSSRAEKSKTNFVEGQSKPTNIEVA
ncbi:CRIB domain-containing protein RIC10 isoform X2 [Capsicum galapagoense]